MKCTEVQDPRVRVDVGPNRDLPPVASAEEVFVVPGPVHQYAYCLADPRSTPLRIWLTGRRRSHRGPDGMAAAQTTIKKIRYWTQILICAVTCAMIASEPSPSPFTPRNRPHRRPRGQSQG